MNNIVRELRAKDKMSQEVLAHKANTTRQTIIRIEKGEKPSFDIAMNISNVFNKSVNDIFFENVVIQVLQKGSTA